MLTIVTDALVIIFEDARKRKWFGNKNNSALQGARSVKRDCSIWQDFLKSKGIKFISVAPKRGMTKMDAERFKKVIRWKERTTTQEMQRC